MFARSNDSQIFKACCFIFSMLIISQLLACWPKKKSIEIHVQARSDTGDPIAHADILLNRVLVARTDTQGRAVIIEDLEINERAAIEVRKESATRYYAPFFHSFVVLDNDEHRYQITGTLYSVPKPSPKQENNDFNMTYEQEPETEMITAEVDDTIINTDAIAEESRQEEHHELQDQDVDEQVQAQEAIVEDKPKEEVPATASVIRPQDIQTINLEQPADQEVPTKPKTVDSAISLITFYSHVGNKALPEVEVYIGYEDKGQLKLACKTNRQGRCSYKFNNTSKQKAATIIARKSGHRSARLVQILQDGDRIRLALPPGESIDVIAINKRYGYARGLEGVHVKINGKDAGKTDQFGYLSYFYRGKAGDLVEVSLIPKEGFLPREFTTDYVVSGPMSLVKYFAPSKPEPLRVAVLPVQAAGRHEGRTLSQFSGDLNQLIRAAMNNYFFTLPSFTEEPYSSLSSRMARENLSLGKLTSQGWQHSELKDGLDAIMIPTIIMQEPLQLEFSFIDSSGKVIIAEKHQLASYQDKNAIAQAIRELTQKIQKKFPFEGSIIAKDDESLTINLGNEAGYQVQVNDEFDVWGLQTDRLGQNKTHTRIGRVRVDQVMADRSRVRIIETAPRSLIDIGDQVIYQEQEPITNDVMQITVIDNGDGKGISQANIYFDQDWLGSSNSEGLAKVAKKRMRGRGILSVIKHGYRDFTKELSLGPSQRIEVKMIRENAFLRVDSQPQGAEVFVDSQRIGVTPLERPVAVPSGFIKVELRGSSEYKPYSQVLQLDEGTLDLTGERSIKLERDLRKQAQQLIDRGDIMTAIQILEGVPREHSDHLVALHQAGELYLSILNQPAKAAEIFGRVTMEPQVRQFNDKRFIGSHINEGVALFLTGQNLEQQSSQAAVAHYQKAIEVLARVESQLRHINQLEYPQAVHNITFYRALSYHRIWDISQDPYYLNEAHRAWRRYIDHAVATVPLSRGESLEKNARTYLRQTEVALEQTEKRTAKGSF